MIAIDALIGCAHRYVSARAELVPFLRAWPTSASHVGPRASTLPVLRCLAQLTEAAPAPGTELAGALAAASTQLAWRQTYTSESVDASFLDNYGWTQIVGPGGLLASDELACGFLLLGPNTHYPSHSHTAEEIYIPLAGTAAWQKGRGAWQSTPPGHVIRHGSLEPHAMRTHNEGLLALYLWRGTGVGEPARLTGGLASR